MGWAVAILMMFISWNSNARSPKLNNRDVRTVRKGFEVSLGFVFSSISLLISFLTFMVQYVPSQDLSYAVIHLQNNSLPVSKNDITQVVQYDDAFDLLITVVNRGNQPAMVSFLDLYVMPYHSTRNPSNNDCIRDGPDFNSLYLYENDISANLNKRGTSSFGDFGRKTVPSFLVSSHSTTSDQHRFSLFDQQRYIFPVPISIVSGLLCVDVGVTATDGSLHDTPELLARLNVSLGQRLSNENFFRENGLNFSHSARSLNLDKDVEDINERLIRRSLTRNWASYISF